MPRSNNKKRSRKILRRKALFLAVLMIIELRRREKAIVDKTQPAFCDEPSHDNDQLYDIDDQQSEQTYQYSRRECQEWSDDDYQSDWDKYSNRSDFDYSCHKNNSHNRYDTRCYNCQADTNNADCVFCDKCVCVSCHLNQKLDDGHQCERCHFLQNIACKQCKYNERTESSDYCKKCLCIKCGIEPEIIFKSYEQPRVIATGCCVNCSQKECEVCDKIVPYTSGCVDICSDCLCSLCGKKQKYYGNFCDTCVCRICKKNVAPPGHSVTRDPFWNWYICGGCRCLTCQRVHADCSYFCDICKCQKCYREHLPGEKYCAICKCEKCSNSKHVHDSEKATIFKLCWNCHNHELNWRTRYSGGGCKCGIDLTFCDFDLIKTPHPDCIYTPPSDYFNLDVFDEDSVGNEKNAKRGAMTFVGGLLQSNTCIGKCFDDLLFDFMTYAPS